MTTEIKKSAVPGSYAIGFDEGRVVIYDDRSRPLEEGVDFQLIGYVPLRLHKGIDKAQIVKVNELTKRK